VGQVLIMRALFLIAMLAACGDNLHPAQRDASSGDAIAGDAPIDTPPQVTGGHCLDRPGLPNELLAPSGALPCEMLPPGFTTETR
jgi:hypothetical protein